jgi:hypothetical protein
MKICLSKYGLAEFFNEIVNECGGRGRMAKTKATKISVAFAFLPMLFGNGLLLRAKRSIITVASPNASLSVGW